MRTPLSRRRRAWPATAHGSDEDTGDRAAHRGHARLCRRWDARFRPGDLPSGSGASAQLGTAAGPGGARLLILHLSVRNDCFRARCEGQLSPLKGHREDIEANEAASGRRSVIPPGAAAAGSCGNSRLERMASLPRSKRVRRRAGDLPRQGLAAIPRVIARQASRASLAGR